MTAAISYEDINANVYDTAAATSRTTASVKKQVTIFTIAAEYWRANRKLKRLADQLVNLDISQLTGMGCQSIEKSLASLIDVLDGLIKTSRSAGLHNRSLTAGPVYSVEKETERLRDVWVNISSSTDAELNEELHAVAAEESVNWDSLWR